MEVIWKWKRGLVNKFFTPYTDVTASFLLDQFILVHPVSYLNDVTVRHNEHDYAERGACVSS